MPGLSFVGKRKAISPQEKIRIIQSFDSMRYTQNYNTKLLIEEPSYLLGTCTYDQYPIAFYENDRFLIFLEGELFGLDSSAMEFELSNLASNVFGDRGEERNYIESWLAKIDGDFIILLVSKSLNSLILINDMLGRLPVYYFQTNDDIIISRDLFFISSIGRTKNLDRMAIAQYLLFGYPLGQRTLLENVSRLNAANLIRIDFKDYKVKISNWQSFNFEHKNEQNKSISQNAKQLASLFSQACQRRHNPDRYNILSLSGGLDSRSIASSLNRDNIHFTAVTRLTDEKKSRLDAKFAEEISKALKFDWRSFYIDPPKGNDVLQLLRIKSGSNYLAMSFIIPFFEKIQEIYGPSITYWTGDGGDKVIPSLMPSEKLGNVSSLINYIIDDWGIFSSRYIINLTQLKWDELIGELRDRLISYPERDWSQKYVHFLICERAFKFLFEGEDRNRCYFWNAMPFYCNEFFKFAMSIPDQQKSNYTLYQYFLEELSAGIAHIDDPDHKLPRFLEGMSSKSFRKKIVHKIPVRFRKAVKHYQSRRPDNKFSEIIRSQINNCDTIDEYLSIDMIRRSLPYLSMIEVKTLFTLTSVIESLERGESSIMQYAETPIL